MAFSLTAVGEDGKEAEANGSGSVLSLTVAEGSSVTFKLQADQDIDAPELNRQDDGRSISLEFELAADKKSAEAKYVVTQFGTFTAKAKVAGSETSADNFVKLVKRSSTPAPAPDDGPSELEIGELDRPFAYVTLVFVAAVAAAIGAAVWSVISRVELPGPGVVFSTDQVVDGTFGQRAAFIVLINGAGIGGITLAIGAWLAAIETRGRLRAPVKAGAPSKGAGVGVEAAELDAIANIVDKARRLRGSMAVVIAGGVVLAISMWGVIPMSRAAPEPSPTATPAETSTGAATPTEEPSSSGAPTGQ